MFKCKKKLCKKPAYLCVYLFLKLYLFFNYFHFKVLNFFYLNLKKIL